MGEMSHEPAALAERVRRALSERSDVAERRMMGGLVFMVAGHMCCGVDRHGLMVRVGPDAYASALAEPDAAVMDLTGREMKGFVLVGGPLSDERLGEWVARGVAHAVSLPSRSRRR
jgi:hypothetical protein